MNRTEAVAVGNKAKLSIILTGSGSGAARLLSKAPDDYTSYVSFSQSFDAALRGHRAAIDGLESIREPIAKAAEALANCLSAGKKILFCGNGGSASDAQHLAAELVGRFRTDRPALPALALHCDTSALTSIANDYGYEKVFSRQIEAHGRPGDVLVAISTSGNSESILEAARRARSIGVQTVALTAQDGGRLKELCDIWIGVPTTVTAHAQEAHILIGHILCGFAEAPFLR